MKRCGRCNIDTHTYLYKVVVASLLSRVPLFPTPQTVARQAPLSMGFPRQEYWSGLPLPFPGYRPDPGIEPVSPALTGGRFLRFRQIPYCLSHQGSPYPDIHVHDTQYTYACSFSVTQPCLTLCETVDCSPPDSSVHEILQARTLGW